MTMNDVAERWLECVGQRSKFDAGSKDRCCCVRGVEKPGAMIRRTKDGSPGDCGKDSAERHPPQFLCSLIFRNGSGDFVMYMLYARARMAGIRPWMAVLMFGLGIRIVGTRQALVERWEEIALSFIEMQMLNQRHRMWCGLGVIALKLMKSAKKLRHRRSEVETACQGDVGSNLEPLMGLQFLYIPTQPPMLTFVP